jgi:hypothetical protein
MSLNPSSVFYLTGALLLSGCVGESKDYAEIGFGNDIEVSEPTTGFTDIKVPLSLSRRGDQADFEVEVSLVLGTASAADLQLIDEQPMLLLPGDDAPFVTVRVYADSLVEGNETARLEIQAGDLSITDGALVLAIVDATPATSVGFRSTGMTLAEGSGTRSVVLDVINPSERDAVFLSLNYNGTAGLGADYLASIGSVTIRPGETEFEIPVEVIDDTLSEGGEQFTISIVSSTVDVMSSELVVFIPGDLSLNDTGVTSYWNGGDFVDGDPGVYLGQDASVGLDASASLNEADGRAGFSFTRMDYAGNPVVGSLTSARCLRDENTGLTWEVKVAATSIPEGDSSMSFAEFVEEQVRLSKLDPENEEYQSYRYHHVHSRWDSANYRYYWYLDDEETNGGAPGVVGPGSFAGYMMQETCAFPNETQVNFSADASRCNSAVYAEFANSLSKCGVKDWRLPTIDELRSVVDYGIGEDGLATEYFPNMAGYTYMSQTPYADERGLYWCMDTSTKTAKLCNKNTPASLMLVRGDE